MYIIFTTTLRGCPIIPILDEETPVTQGQILCPRSQEKKMAEPDLPSTTVDSLLPKVYFEGRFVYLQIFITWKYIISPSIPQILTESLWGAGNCLRG